MCPPGNHIYDANGWLAQVEYFDATASKVGEVLITRDDLGRPVEIRDGRTDLRQTFVPPTEMLATQIG